jgi:hypothetical protein
MMRQFAPLSKTPLREGGFELEIAINGNKALAILESRKDTLQGLVISPAAGKSQDAVGRSFPTLPVVYLGGHAGHEWPSNGVPHATLPAKPFALAQLLTAISTLLNVSDCHLRGAQLRGKPVCGKILFLGVIYVRRMVNALL